LDPPQPLGPIATVLVEFVFNHGEMTVRLTRKPDITIGPAQVVALDDNVCDLCPLLRVIRVQLRTLGWTSTS
jgi:hypothetical protein